jgi:hypothetical protein
MWIDEHVVKKTLCVLPANSFLLKKGKLGRNLCYIVTQLQAGRPKSQDATTTTALTYYTAINAQALLGNVHLITGHGGPDRE